MKISIVIPAYNEENRIVKTLEHYADYFDKKDIKYELLVVLNGCVDSTLELVESVQKKYATIKIIDIKQAGKGLAIKVGFKNALTRENDLIGFVDADMATQPQYFYELIERIGDADGIVASRYMKESTTIPARPWIKEWGRIIVYNPLIFLLFGMKYIDYQCGAKLFKREAVETIVDQLTVRQWAFDVELLYLMKKHEFIIKEIPTVWQDQDDSKFGLNSGIGMIGHLFTLRMQYFKKNK
ncbi:glycosyltransferase [bacterium]|nr:glycosyltransferase [bacterium]